MSIQTFAIRLCCWHNLIFFVLLFSCQEKSAEIKIIWTHERATGISVPAQFIHGSSHSLLSVRLSSDTATAILGDLSFHSEEIVFEPLVPFTRGLTYDIFAENKRIGQVTIPMADPSGASALLQIYPTSDTVPENLLKVYFHFSKPMQEGVSARHIFLVHHQDTLPGVFLDLQPELWDTSRTLLTLWLDPGRIKRDLIPNQKMGTPLKQGERYTLVVNSKWKDIDGLSLKKTVEKEFYVTSRDSLSPDPTRWKLELPRPHTRDAFVIRFDQPLDYSLITSSLTIVNDREEKLNGHWKTEKEEKQITFIPLQSWGPGNYTLHVSSRLEDLAGNNLNRPFDVDIRNSMHTGSSETRSLPFFLSP